MEKNKILFIHGGPGMNSEGDRLALAPLLGRRGIEIHFWNEPSRLRPEGRVFEPARAFEGWIDSLSDTVLKHGPFDAVLGNSFGALGALYWLKREPSAFKKLIMVSPVLDLFGTFRKMIGFAIDDFRATRPDASKRLGELLGQAKQFSDAPMMEAMSLVYEDPALALHYFVNPAHIALWAAGFAELGFSPDTESRALVTQALGATGEDPWSEALKDVSVSLLVGDRDPVAETERWQRELGRRCKKVEHYRFLDSGHFPQFEEPKKFLDVLEQAASREN
jgi:pimeloyl-ACP methyl ester carboxylesterase